MADDLAITIANGSGIVYHTGALLSDGAIQLLAPGATPSPPCAATPTSTGTATPTPTGTATPTATPTPTPPPAVGGIGLDPDLGALPLETLQSSGSNMGVPPGIAAAVVASALALGSAAWYTRKRWR